MEQLQNHMQYPTFLSLLTALDENYALLKATDFITKKKVRNMRECIQNMEKSVQLLEEDPVSQPDEQHRNYKKAA